MNNKLFSEYTDEELIIEFKLNKTEKAFELLMKRYKNPLYNFVFRFLGDYTLCSDIVQETFIRVYKNADSYKDIGRFSTWIYTIANNLARTEFARLKKGLNISLTNSGLDGDDMELPDNRMRPDNEIELKFNEEVIQKALLKIPENFRELVILRDIQDLSYEEIAEITELPLGTVKSRISRGRLQLQKLLKDYYKND